MVYTYAGNPYGIPQNPNGGDQFLNGLSQGGTAYARAQHDYNWAAETIVTIGFDMCVKFTGVTPATDNIGSWSMQDSATATYIQSLYTWVDYTHPVTYRAGYFTNEVQTAPGAFPSGEWEALLTDHWYRQTVTVDFSTWLVTQCTIQDLTIGGPVHTANPEGWHFIRYTTPVMPTAFRFFTGGTTAGNLTAWDNLSIEGPQPTAACCYPDGTCAVTTQDECEDGIWHAEWVDCSVAQCPQPMTLGDMNCDGAVNTFDIDPFVIALTDPDGYAELFPGCSILNGDINCDGALNTFDIDPFVLCLTGGGCSCP